MKRRSLHSLTVAAALALIAPGVPGVPIGLGRRAESASPPAINVQLFQFHPGLADVPKGTTVTWTNEDDITHTITSGTPGERDGHFDVELAGRGATAAVEFTEPGVYPYFCSRHPSMRGEIRVD